jgi:hypothetical protein
MLDLEEKIVNEKNTCPYVVGFPCVYSINQGDLCYDIAGQGTFG